MFEDEGKLPVDTCKERLIETEINANLTIRMGRYRIMSFQSLLY